MSTTVSSFRPGLYLNGHSVLLIASTEHPQNYRIFTTALPYLMRTPLPTNEDWHRSASLTFSTKQLFSHRDDVSLANPFGPVAHGRKQVAETMERAASHYRDGEATGFERIVTSVTPQLAYIVEVERYRAKVGGRQDPVPVTLRVTSIFRPDDGTWKTVHRHADPITSARTPDSVIQ